MRILLLGVGMQGKAALYDLSQQPDVNTIIAADQDLSALRCFANTLPNTEKVQCEQVNGTDAKSLNRLFSQNIDVAVDLLPIMCIPHVVQAAIRNKVHLVNTFYATDEVQAMSDHARQAGVIILPEMGMDPGIDLVILGRAVQFLDTVNDVFCYGGGIPEPAASDNPLNYKVTWNFDGVLRSYRRAGKAIRNRGIVNIAENNMFSDENTHTVHIDNLGTVEAFPNGDALRYANMLNLDQQALNNMGRFAVRWPGHCEFWKKIIDLHLLDDEPVIVDGQPVNRRRFLAAAIEPHIRYGPQERDIVIIRIDVTGSKDNQRQRIICDVVDYRDRDTGFTAMSRTVGFTAAIAAHMIGAGLITESGLRSPVHDVPWQPFMDALAARNIQISWRVE